MAGVPTDAATHDPADLELRQDLGFEIVALRRDLKIFSDDVDAFPDDGMQLQEFTAVGAWFCKATRGWQVSAPERGQMTQITLSDQTRDRSSCSELEQKQIAAVV